MSRCVNCEGAAKCQRFADFVNSTPPMPALTLREWAWCLKQNARALWQLARYRLRMWLFYGRVSPSTLRKIDRVLLP